MIFDNLDELIEAHDNHVIISKTIKRKLEIHKGVLAELERLGTPATTLQKNAMLADLDLAEYVSTDAETRRIFNATEPEPE
jgi:hypothetical protein